MADLRDLIEQIDPEPIPEPIQKTIDETRAKIRECFKPFDQRFPVTLRALAQEGRT